MLEQTRQRYGFRVYGFVVMLEHVHLLISEPEKGTIANAIQSLKIAAAMRTSSLREMDGVRSPLWQKRYFDLNIRDYEQFVGKLKYIHRNPVKRGLCAKPEDWRWSSFNHYATGEDCGVEIESRWTATKRNKKKLGRSGTTPDYGPTTAQIWATVHLVRKGGGSTSRCCRRGRRR